MQEHTKKESETAEFSRGDSLSLLLSLVLAVALSFAFALMPLQLLIAMLLFLVFTGLIIAVTNHNKP